MLCYLNNILSMSFWNTSFSATQTLISIVMYIHVQLVSIMVTARMLRVRIEYSSPVSVPVHPY